MKIIHFDYTDAKGKETKRTLLATTFPGTFHAGTDVGVLESVELAEYVLERKVLLDEYIKQIAELDAEYDLKFQYRQFQTAQMKNISIEEI